MVTSLRHELAGAFGDPIDENPTGVMMEPAFAAAGLNWRYQLIHVSAADLPAAVAGARSLGFRGFNLTIPHKVAVLEHLDAIAPDAALMGAVNTVRREGNRLIGENTDGKGFLRGVREDAGVDPAGKRVVMLGAGGAARAVATELALAGASRIAIVNRTVQRGAAMVDDLRANTGADVQFVAWEGTYAVPADTDIFVNATSIGLYPDVDAMPDVDLGAARAGMLVCDVVFNPPETPLVKAAKARGLPVLDGLSMLVYQGVIGFELWTGQRAPEAVMKQALRDALSV